MTALARVLLLVAAIFTSTGASGRSNPLRYTGMSARDYAEDYWRSCVLCGNIYAQDVTSANVKDDCHKARLQRINASFTEAGAKQMDMLNLFGESEFGLQKNTLAAAPQLQYYNVSSHFDSVAFAALVLHYPIQQRKLHLTYIKQEFLSLKVRLPASTAPLYHHSTWTALQEQKQELSWDIADAASTAARVEVPNTASRPLGNAIHTCLARKVQFYEHYGIGISNTALIMAYRDTEFPDAYEAAFFPLKEKGMASIDSLAQLHAAIAADKTMLAELLKEDLESFQLEIELALNTITPLLPEHSESLKSIFVGLVIERLLGTAAEAHKAYHAAKAGVMFEALSILKSEPSDFVREDIHYTKHTYDDLIPNWTEKFRGYMNALVRHVGLYATHVQECLLHRNTFLVAVARIEFVLLAYQRTAQAVWPAFARALAIQSEDYPIAAAQSFSMPDIRAHGAMNESAFRDSSNNSPNNKQVLSNGVPQECSNAPYSPALDQFRCPDHCGHSMHGQYHSTTFAQQFHSYQQPHIPGVHTVPPAQYPNYNASPFTRALFACHGGVNPHVISMHHPPVYTAGLPITHGYNPVQYSAHNLSQYTQGHLSAVPLAPCHPAQTFPPTSIANLQAHFSPVSHTDHGSAWPSSEQHNINLAQHSTGHFEPAQMQHSVFSSDPSAVNCLSDSGSSQPPDVIVVNTPSKFTPVLPATTNNFKKDYNPAAVQFDYTQSSTVNVSSTPTDAKTTLSDEQANVLGGNSTHVDSDAKCILADGTIYTPRAVRPNPIAAPVLVQKTIPTPTSPTAVVAQIKADSKDQQVSFGTKLPNKLTKNQIVSPDCQQPQNCPAFGQSLSYNAKPKESTPVAISTSSQQKARDAKQNISGCASINGQPGSNSHIKSKTGTVQQATSVINSVKLQVNSPPIVDESKSILIESFITKIEQPHVDSIYKTQGDELDWKTKEDSKLLDSLTLQNNQAPDKKNVQCSTAESNIENALMANNVSSNIIECKRNINVHQSTSKPHPVDCKPNKCSCGIVDVSAIDASLKSQGEQRVNADSLAKSAYRLQNLFPHLIFANCSNVQLEERDPEDIGTDFKDVVVSPNRNDTNGRIVQATPNCDSLDHDSCRLGHTLDGMDGRKNATEPVYDILAPNLSKSAYDQSCEGANANNSADTAEETFNSTEPVTETTVPVVETNTQPAKKKRPKHKPKNQPKQIVNGKNTSAKHSPSISPPPVTPVAPKAAQGKSKNGHLSKSGNLTTSYKLVSEPQPDAKLKSNIVMQQPGATPPMLSRNNACAEAKAMTSTTRLDDHVLQSIITATEQRGGTLTVPPDGPPIISTSGVSDLFDILKSVTANIATNSVLKTSNGNENITSNILPIPKRLLLSEANREIRLHTLGLPDASDLDNIFSMKALTDKRPFTMAEKNNLWIKLSNVVQLWKSEEATSERHTMTCFDKLKQAIDNVIAFKEAFSKTYTEFLKLCHSIKLMSNDEIKEQRAFMASEYKKCNIERILKDIDDAEGKVHSILRVYVNVAKDSQLKTMYYKIFSRLDGFQSNGLDEALIRISSEFAKEFDGYKNLMVAADVKYAKVLNAYTDSLLNHSLFTTFQIIKVDKIEPLIDSSNDDINNDNFTFNLRFLAESILDLSYKPSSYIEKTLDLWVHMIRARYEYLTILNNYGILEILSNHEKLVPRFAYQLRAKLPTN